MLQLSSQLVMELCTIIARGLVGQYGSLDLDTFSGAIKTARLLFQLQLKQSQGSPSAWAVEMVLKYVLGRNQWWMVSNFDARRNL
jgi:hypothetical protein